MEQTKIKVYTNVENTHTDALCVFEIGFDSISYKHIALPCYQRLFPCVGA